jgi:tRNA threonylcarbamoyladenosine biosynthesis protein TsaB
MWLTIDTSLDACTTALVQDDRIVALDQQIIGKGHAEALPLMLDALVQDIDVKAITRIAVCVGPGSFTGQRVGIAAAKALALAWDIPAHGCSSLDAVAYAAYAGKGGHILVVHDAKRGQVYVQGYGLAELSSPRAMSPAAVVEVARNWSCTIAGTGVGLLHAIDPGLPSANCAPYPAPLSMIAVATRAAEPLYVRGPDALTLAQRGLA